MAKVKKFPKKGKQKTPGAELKAKREFLKKSGATEMMKKRAGKKKK